MSLSLLVACGSGQDAGSGEPQEDQAATAQDKPLSKADLEKAAITGQDLDGYEINPALAAPSASRRTADPARCTPVVQALGGSSGFTATARVGRMIFSKKHGPGASMILSSHSSGDAARVIDAFRAAAERCKTFKDIQVDFRYSDTQVEPGAGYGDESVSLRLTQLAADSENEEPVRVPFAVVAVRQGTTVAMFSTFNRPRGPRKPDPARVPDAIIKAQLTKLDELGLSG
ncbi:hypothetical protein ABZ446_40210 [Streptomyces sp. NPDC005813]|uniref:hypothetical protein n=1 Tax=Streptomyces sp. NPDC005813 TaxID=3155592 RepID=UPI0033D346E0